MWAAGLRVILRPRIAQLRQPPTWAVVCRTHPRRRRKRWTTGHSVSPAARWPNVGVRLVRRDRRGQGTWRRCRNAPSSHRPRHYGSAHRESRSTGSASAFGTWFSKISEPLVVRPAPVSIAVADQHEMPPQFRDRRRAVRHNEDGRAGDRKDSVRREQNCDGEQRSDCCRSGRRQCVPAGRAVIAYPESGSALSGARWITVPGPQP